MSRPKVEKLIAGSGLRARVMDLRKSLDDIHNYGPSDVVDAEWVEQALSLERSIRMKVARMERELLASKEEA